ncbi:hypothetical protein Fleli_0989 [Bernardetia litoralis DSM 6794]|uniref:Uncharacterized protein n=1 Tax=Bernardetia litoralis (strain ATCC 23117 / DSM 6794 / NBRC 15988 / NCIMB 1366 / Fx l1 / Sio-4) TaxID=880071 RepID=I4AHK2_BERLS|nr:hypothetical protein [Bernardetia litoralis]AFM03437.1 hypothetical protein Fleli_0989 [Bernardetia litoralis DSM 6794]
MKNFSLFCSLFFYMVAFFVSSSFVLAQNTQLPKAYITKELYLRLDGNNTPQDAKIFEADILELHLATIEQANRFFGFFNDPSVTFETNIITQKVIVTLIPDAEKQNWNLNEWGMYLKNKVSAQRQQFEGYIDFTKK